MEQSTESPCTRNNFKEKERVNVEAGEVYQELHVDDLGNRSWSDRLKV